MQEEPTIPAGHVILIIVGALLAAIFLNAPGLLETAERQSGSTRSLAVGVMSPIATISNALFIDAPHQALDRLAHGAPDEPVVVAEEQVETSTTIPTTSTTVPERVPTAADPLRLLIAGDSMVGQFGPVLEGIAERTDVVDGEHFFEFSTGLTRPDFLDWEDKVAELAGQYDSEVLVLYLGANDAQNISVDGVWHDYSADDPIWVAEYRDRVASMMEHVEALGLTTYWMGLPDTDSESQTARYEFFNSVYETVAADYATVTYISAWEWMQGGGGTFSEYLTADDGTLTDMRQGDGIHYTTAGARHLANRVFPLIAEDFGIDAG